MRYIIILFLFFNFSALAQYDYIIGDNNGEQVRLATAELIDSLSGGTLAGVSSLSDDATKSTYTMTSTIPVVFNNSSASAVLHLEEANKRVTIGGTTQTSVNAPLYVWGAAHPQMVLKLNSATTTALSGFTLLNGNNAQGNFEFSQNTYTPINNAKAAQLRMTTNGAGGLLLNSANASSTIDFVTNDFAAVGGSVLAMRILANGNITTSASGLVGLGIASPISKAHIYESTANTGTTIGLTIEQGSTGDAVTQYKVAAKTYVAGIDNSDGDAYKISGSVDLATDNYLKIDATAETFDIRIDDVDKIKVNAQRTEITNAVRYSAILDVTPFAAQVDNYAPAGGDSASIFTIDLVGNQTLTGMNIPNFPGLWVTLINTDAVDTLTIANQNASSTSVYRFTTESGNDLIIPPGGRADCLYIGSGWRAWKMYFLILVFRLKSKFYETSILFRNYRRLAAFVTKLFKQFSATIRSTATIVRAKSRKPSHN